jgi:hypothetical protein
VVEPSPLVHVTLFEQPPPCFLAELDQSQGLLKITVADHVEPEDARSCLENLRLLSVSSQAAARGRELVAHAKSCE